VQLADESAGPEGVLPPYIGRDREGNGQWWRISCRDVINRERYLTVLIDRDRVVLVGPPGETALLSLNQASQLRDALREASDRAGG